ncbi:MAG: LCP family protein [Symploca sp. SIO2G7]|nr:LCP family protein [Symploca sp. SIO2G7]
MPAKKTDEKTRSWSKKTPSVGKPPSKGKPGHWLWLGLGFGGVAMLSATAGALLAVSLSSTPLLQSQLSPEEAAIFGGGKSISRGTLRLPELTRPVNILVLGTKVLTSDLDLEPIDDSGYEPLVNSFEGLSDTMLLVRFDPEQEKLAVLSIPRDTRAYVEGHGITKINAANYHGGPALTAKAVSELLNGVGVDRYIRVNVQGIEKLVDALGGVTVYVPKDLKYKDDTQHLYIDLKEGRQHLNGEQAVQFLRFRHDEYGDVGRIQRQQTLMRALIEQTLSPATVGRLPKILSVIQSHIDTNLSVEELVALMGFGSQTERSNVQMLLLPGDFNGTGQQEVSYWLPSRRRIKQIMAKHFDLGYDESEEADPTLLRIAIQNSTDDSEAVQTLVSKLREEGYRNVYVAEQWKEPLQITRIIAQQGDEVGATAIREDLGFGETRVESTGSLSSQVTIQLGQDWLQQLKQEIED